MKLTTSLIASVLATSVIALTATSVIASEKHGEQHGKKHSVEHRVEHLTKRLDLTTAQQVSITDLIKEHKANRPARGDRDAMKAKRQSMKQKFKAMMENPDFDESTVKESIEQRANAQTERKVQQLKLQHSIYQQLNDVQRADYLKLLKKKMRKMAKHKMHNRKMMKHHDKHHGHNEG
ncbi:Spy/CpxP family protein refolding chaperone [Psychrobium sp. 1_MG-2023]|uniref:Spy/CpxP family protein refolding chaperone n=1 Tax=Psychrobium sp. 1_MG-2023 TaxID=3062624 RepID=UPI000C34D6DE|nr:Spy/CpxP family protein refolding chaperone [Psychrobium sp. 1_MG-2023]MDP2561046.1 Spy/CpxP family protein refolding chaperone [Psychrobium sp. 1_MG-2023]PKF58338.1 hypothetical protein CW748_04035 [Alteromonadales bacterium alter-6D02]